MALIRSPANAHVISDKKQFVRRPLRKEHHHGKSIVYRSPTVGDYPTNLLKKNRYTKIKTLEKNMQKKITL